MVAAGPEPRHVALLRGVNVAGRSKIAMAELRAVLRASGFTGVSTYLQSGNVLLDAPVAHSEAVGPAIESAIATALGLEVKVLIRSAAELTTIVACNPLGAEPDSPARYFVTFLSRAADPNLAPEIESLASGDDRLWIRGAEAYLWCLSGFSGLRLISRIEKRLAMRATTRNWHTVRRLEALARA